MGVSKPDLDLLLRLAEEGYIPGRASVIEIGAQQLSNSFLEAGDRMEQLGRLLGATPGLSLPDRLNTTLAHGATEHLSPEAPLARPFWQWLGFDYASIDIDGSPGSIPLDLNYDDVPPHAVGKYNLVTNFGTTEHVANQLNAFKIIHDLTMPGGVMIHNLPAQGMLNHGLINYNPKFFWMLARSNGYKLLYIDYSGSSVVYRIPQNIIDSAALFNPEIESRLADTRVSDAGLVVALQKTFDIAFVAPLDVNTGATTDNKELEERYWTVFKPHPFAGLRIQAALPGSRMLSKTDAARWLSRGAGQAINMLDSAGAAARRTVRRAVRRVIRHSSAEAARLRASYTRTKISFRAKEDMNRMEEYRTLFDGVVPWAGTVPKGYLVDFSGALTDGHFRTMFGVDPKTVGGHHQETRLPVMGDGEGWFEAANWVLAAREARDSYVMMTLGACYGAQAVGAYRILQQLNPMPCTLVAVEPVPENYEWTARHFRDNGLDPDEHWLVPHAISGSNDPVLFPIGAPGSGAQNCISTNHADTRRHYADEFIKAGQAETALYNLLMHNTTGIIKDLVPGHDFTAEVKMVSAITLKELLGPFDLVDYLESDIQQSEITVFPPFIELLRKKVRRIHIGTHGGVTHWSLHELFERNGWKIVFSFEPNAKHETALGSFETNDGVLTVLNPDL